MPGTALTITQLAREMGATVLPDVGNKRFRMEVRSESSNNLYVVAWDINDRQWGCSCPGWRNARNGHLNRKCKHTTAVQQRLGQAATPLAIR